MLFNIIIIVCYGRQKLQLTLVPYSIACSLWKVPCLPVKPCTMSLVFLSIQTFAVALICLELEPQAALQAETALLRINDCLTAAGALAMTEAILNSYNQMICISEHSLSSWILVWLL
jgi:hypothetical protein